MAEQNSTEKDYAELARLAGKVVAYAHTNKIGTIVFPSPRDDLARSAFRVAWRKKYPDTRMPRIFSLGAAIFKLGTNFEVSNQAGLDPVRMNERILTGLKERYPKTLAGKSDLHSLGNTLIIAHQGGAGTIVKFVKKQLQEFRVRNVKVAAMYAEGIPFTPDEAPTKIFDFVAKVGKTRLMPRRDDIRGLTRHNRASITAHNKAKKQRRRIRTAIKREVL